MVGRKPASAISKKVPFFWRKFMPDYEIVRWDESNLDFGLCEYACEAYKAKKWAFASDYARFKILYERGGIYLDTDVEVIRSLEPILERGPYMGFEVDCSETTKGTVASGLGTAANLGLACIGTSLILTNRIILSKMMEVTTLLQSLIG